MEIDDLPEGVPDDVREWLEQDYGVEDWESAIFHGGPDEDWSLEIFYDDGTSSTIDIGDWESIEDWVWDLYDWLDIEVEDDVDVSYTGD